MTMPLQGGQAPRRREQLAAAHASSAGRSARTIHGGQAHTLRQTVLALVAGRVLGEHESPGDYLDIPPTRHDLAAIDDSAVLLSVVMATRE